MVINTCGLSCPQPVLMVFPHLGGSDPIDVVVDNNASQENVSRAARKQGWNVQAKPMEDGTVRLELRK